jgi:hypothetical protein
MHALALDISTVCSLQRVPAGCSCHSAIDYSCSCCRARLMCDKLDVQCTHWDLHLHMVMPHYSSCAEACCPPVLLYALPLCICCCVGAYNLHLHRTRIPVLLTMLAIPWLWHQKLVTIAQLQQSLMLSSACSYPNCCTPCTHERQPLRLQHQTLHSVTACLLQSYASSICAHHLLDADPLNKCTKRTLRYTPHAL